MRVAVIGGTGRFGSALAWRLADAGHPVIIGSRDALRAAAAAGRIGALAQSGAAVEGARNRDAAAAAEVVVVAVPARGHGDILRDVAPALRGRVVVDTCVCHHERDGGLWVAPREGSAAARVRRLAPRGATVAAALHAVAARSLRHPRRHPAGDVLIAAEGPAALEAAGILLDALGLRWWAAGDLAAAAGLEQLACLLARLSAQHGAPAPAMRLHGLPAPRLAAPGPSG